MKTINAFSRRETATMLAALRNYQADMSTFGFDAHENPIATDDGALVALTSAEIDTLCERLNFEEDTTGALAALKRGVYLFAPLHTRDLSHTGPVTPTAGGEAIQKMRDAIKALEGT